MVASATITRIRNVVHWKSTHSLWMESIFYMRHVWIVRALLLSCVCQPIRKCETIYDYIRFSIVFNQWQNFTHRRDIYRNAAECTYTRTHTLLAFVSVFVVSHSIQLFIVHQSLNTVQLLAGFGARMWNTHGCECVVCTLIRLDFRGRYEESACQLTVSYDPCDWIGKLSFAVVIENGWCQGTVQSTNLIDLSQKLVPTSHFTLAEIWWFCLTHQLPTWCKIMLKFAYLTAATATPTTSTFWHRQ